MTKKVQEGINCRIGIYVRESRDDQGENYDTIETQRDLLLHFAEEKLQGKIFKVYLDDNVSGSGFDREGISRLKTDVQAGLIDMLIMKDLSRLGRNNAQTLLFLDYLEEYGVRVLTFDGKYDSSRDNDTVGIETWVNERYVKDVSRKIRTSMRFRIERGEYLGSAPYGYVKSPGRKNRLEIDKREADIVRDIFRQYADGASYAQISAVLDAMGITPPSGIPGAGWNAAAIGRILSGRVYIGDTVQGVSEKISFKSKKTRRINPDKWVVTENTHEAIIDRELFRKVAEIRSKHNNKKVPNDGESRSLNNCRHLFRGIIFCGGCGSYMFARKRDNRAMSYICGKYAKSGRNGCTSHHVREEDLLCAVKAVFEDLLDNEAAVMEAGNLLMKSLSKAAGRTRESNAAISKLKEKKRQQDILYRDRLEGNISEELFLRANKYLEESIAVLEKSLQVGQIESEAMEPKELCKSIKTCIGGGQSDNRMIKAAIKRIIIYDRGEMMRQGQAAPDEGAVVVEVNHSGQ